MARKKYTAEQIITKLREAEIESGKGRSTPDVCKKLGIAVQTYYRWRKEYGGLRMDQAKRCKQLEKENAPYFRTFFFAFALRSALALNRSSLR